MDEADDDYHGPPLPGGQRPMSGNSQMRQQMSYSSFNSSGSSQRQPQTLQMALQMEREMERERYLRQQLELQRSIQLRRALFQEQHQHYMSELESQHHLHHLQQDPLIQQQRLMELEQHLRSPGRGHLSLQEEQLLLQQQATRQRLLRQQQQMQEQRRLHRDLRVPDQGMPAGSRSGPSLQSRERHLAEEDAYRAEEVAQARESTRELSPMREAAQVVSQKMPSKDEDARPELSGQKESQLKKDEESSPIPPKDTDASLKEGTAQNEVSRKRKESEVAIQTVQDKKPKTEEKSDRPEEASNTTQSQTPVRDIALLLRATEDPAVKRAGLERSSSQPDLEQHPIAAKKDEKSDVEEKTKSPLADHNKPSELEALALEALTQNSRSPSSQKESRPNRQMAALLETLQNTTPPPSPTPQQNEEGEEEEEAIIDSPDHPQTFEFSVPELPKEPSYIGPDSPKGKSDSEGTKYERGKDVGFGILADLMPGKKSKYVPGFKERDVKEPVLLPDPDESPSNPVIYTIPIDEWWPSNAVVKRERRLHGDMEDDDGTENQEIGTQEMSPAASAAMKDRIQNQVEPGVLEKIPHCKLHRIRSRGRRDQCPIPLFCFQVTESHCTDMMVCCSICSTWRHIQCGGHYTKCPVQTNSGSPFVAVCDRCHEEAEYLKDNPTAFKRMEAQRIEHLRRSLATTAVIRQASLAKHGGTYKWPLGSVTNTHIGGHTRSVHSRHERAEKQWSETAAKLGNGLGYRPKERAKTRTREFERILQNVEDAEGHADRHNVMLFLQRDTARERPVGFEIPHRNFFDPEEDPISDHEYASDDDSESRSAEAGVARGSGEEAKKGSEDDGEGDVCAKAGTSADSQAGADAVSVDSKRSQTPALTADSSSADAENSKLTRQRSTDSDIASLRAASSCEEADDKEEKENDALSLQTSESQADDADDDTNFLRNFCAREDCKKKPRFDSMFCSDACGVAAIERDLLNSFEYAADIHPSLLRP